MVLDVYDKNGNYITTLIRGSKPHPALWVVRLIDAVESTERKKVPATEINCEVNGHQADVNEKGVFFRDYTISADGTVNVVDTTNLKILARSEKYKEVDLTVEQSIPPSEIYVWKTEVYGK